MRRIVTTWLPRKGELLKMVERFFERSHQR